MSVQNLQLLSASNTIQVQEVT